MSKSVGKEPSYRRLVRLVIRHEIAGPQENRGGNFRANINVMR